MPGCNRPRACRRTLCHSCRHRIYRSTSGVPLRTDLDPENVETAVIRRAFPEGLTEAERRAVGQRLLRLGYSISHIANLSGASTRTVTRWKAALTA
ncbi:hypothetical protein ACFVHW_31765 [Streptomyces sp. NPDC127110]|uniref:hypothetical protein n=1 Tax=Streptomyces sp. NPDC127110 TaxID=3345362 RepID=UPI003625A236